MSKVGDAVSPDGADNIGLSPVANTATAPSTKRGENRKDERTDFEVSLLKLLQLAVGHGLLTAAVSVPHLVSCPRILALANLHSAAAAFLNAPIPLHPLPL